MVNRLKAGALLVVVFAAGAAAGWGAGRWTVLSWTPRYRDADAMMAFLSKQLSLSSAQQDSVRAVLQRHRPELDSIWHLVHPRVDSLRMVMRHEINAQLTPGQRKRYRALTERFEHQRPDSVGTSKERN